MNNYKNILIISCIYIQSIIIGFGIGYYVTTKEIHIKLSVVDGNVAVLQHNQSEIMKYIKGLEQPLRYGQRRNK